jgi:prepilin-type N-terminal cleavage/methylation domain-containing protein
LRDAHNMSAPESRCSAKSRGFTMIEMAIVIAIVLIVSSMAFISLQPVLKDARTNTAFNNVLMQLRIARQRAVTERKQYIVCLGNTVPNGAATPLGAPNAQSIQVYRWDAGTALSAAAQVTAITLPYDIRFQTLTGLPNAPTTVPDGFGTGSTAIDFDQGVNNGIRDQIMFLPDGSVRDTDGNLSSGIVYIARNGEFFSSRAVTIYGATGRIRGWRLDKVSGSPLWSEQ